MKGNMLIWAGVVLLSGCAQHYTQEAVSDPYGFFPVSGTAQLHHMPLSLTSFPGECQELESRSLRTYRSSGIRTRESFTTLASFLAFQATEGQAQADNSHRFEKPDEAKSGNSCPVGAASTARADEGRT